jgi:hypothetical protein
MSGAIGILNDSGKISAWADSMSYEIEPAASTDISWIASFEAKVYSSDDAVPEKILRDWYSKNPNGFSTIKCDGQLIGHVDLLPLRASVLRRFVSGVITEREIRGSELHSPEEHQLVTTVYIESVAIVPPTGSARAQAVKYLLLNGMGLINRVGHSERIESVIAVAATNSGQRFLEALGFCVVSHAKDRKDRHDLYGAQLASLQGEILRRFRPSKIECALAEI